MLSGEVVKTDASGRWRFDSVPLGLREVLVEMNHAGFRPTRRTLTRGEFGLERGESPASKIVLESGLTVTGRVTDEAGTPIAGALIRTKFMNDIREARTGADGIYRLAGCEPRPTRIVEFSRKGRAMDMQDVSIAPQMEPVNFRMKPGGIVRVRVLDQHGKGVPEARIFFQEWRGRIDYFEFDHADPFADQNGVWVWNEAPLDEFKADICSPGDDADALDLVKQPLIARAAEYVFRLPAALVVSGKVSDAETGEPIKVFRVIPGFRSSATEMNWIHGQSFLASDGKYQMRQTRGESAYLVRIEADDYQPAVSRDIKSTEGRITVDFALKRGRGIDARKPGRNIDARVVTPDNRPAAGARIALGVAGSQIWVENGNIDDGLTYCRREATDAEGRFRFPPQDADFQIVITHPSGYAHIKSGPAWESGRTIRLEPWARVEGTFRIGPTPVANVPLSIDVPGLDSYGKDVPSIHAVHYVTTEPGGRFVFDRVVAGPGRIGRRIDRHMDHGATEVTSACAIGANFPGGKTVHIDLGGSGRPVVGRALALAAGRIARVRALELRCSDCGVSSSRCARDASWLRGLSGPRRPIPHR